VSRPAFLHGCNYPWSTDGATAFYGLDFGANVWGSHLGVSTRRDAVAGDFLEMAALGFTWTRWFLFGDGRSGIVYDERGFPAGIDDQCYDDLDAGLEVARDAGIAVDLVLLDHQWLFEGLTDRIVDAVTGQVSSARLPYGRSSMLRSADGRDALIDEVIAPLLRRYGPAGSRADLAAQVGAVEFMNEPDFVIEEWEADLSRRVPRPLPFVALAECVARVSDLVHTHTTALSTLGGARVRNLWAWDDPSLGLDLLQVHSYPDMRHPDRDVDVFGLPAASHGLRRPLLLGEFPGNGAEQCPSWASPPPTTLDEYLEFAVTAGYAGAWPWSFSGTDAYGRLPEAPLRRFAAAHPALVNPRCRFLTSGSAWPRLH
jgi:hypothetical protein